MTLATYNVPSLQSEEQREDVARILKTLDGVISYEIHPEYQTIAVNFEESKVSDQQIKNTLLEQGFITA